MEKHDVAILGGGLAGLTLAMQLKQARSDLSILLLEKRGEDAPVATHKVGESTVELGAYYLREALGLKDYLFEHQLRKFGFRFFFSPEHRDDIARRVEVGGRLSDPIPTYQIDRGLLENDLLRKLEDLGVEVRLGASVKELNISGNGHQVCFEKAGEECIATARWVVDATGRRSFLKRNLNLEKALDHDVNAVWFRLDSEIDIDDWSDNAPWRNLMEPGRRRLATNHLMGAGYWVWLIPLVSGSTSIGIVADAALHPFDTFHTFDHALKWLAMHEPVAAEMLGLEKGKLLDFKVMKHYAHDTKQFYSTERWGVTGDAGAFLDPFYSPGTDFIALANSWLTELILRDTDGEDITLRTMIYEHAHRELLNGWTLLYKDMYGLFGKTQIMLFKIVWDWGAYWAVPTLIFMNKGYTDLAFLKYYSAVSGSIGQRFARLNAKMQALFQAWSRYDVPPCSDAHINIFTLDCLLRFYQGLEGPQDPEQLVSRVEANLSMLEQLSAEMFRLVSAQISSTPMDMKVDPYTMSIDDSGDVLQEKSKSPAALGVVGSIRDDLSKVWLSSVPSTNPAYVW